MIISIHSGTKRRHYPGYENTLIDLFQFTPAQSGDQEKTAVFEDTVNFNSLRHKAETWCMW